MIRKFTKSENITKIAQVVLGKLGSKDDITVIEHPLDDDLPEDKKKDA